MTSKSKKSGKKPAKKTVPKKNVTKKKTAVRKSATAIKKTIAKKNTATAKKEVAKKPIVKKKPAVKKSTPAKKSIVTKKATPKKSIKRKVIVAEVANEKVVSPDARRANNEIDMLIEVVANNNSLTEEKSLVEHTVITELPVPDKNTQQGKFARKYDKHQIQLSSVKKGGPKPSGKKPLW